MIDRKRPHFFDTDILYFFICSKSEWVLFKLFPNIIIPGPVFAEALKFKGNLGTYFKNKLIYYIANGEITKKEFRDLFSQEYKLYFRLQSPEHEFKKIGRGESSTIAMAAYHSGIIASSNFSDVVPFAKHYSISHVGTDDILSYALQLKIITMDELLTIRNKIINNGGFLPRIFVVSNKYY